MKTFVAVLFIGLALFVCQSEAQCDNCTTTWCIDTQDCVADCDDCPDPNYCTTLAQNPAACDDSDCFAVIGRSGSCFICPTTPPSDCAFVPSIGCVSQNSSWQPNADPDVCINSRATITIVTTSGDSCIAFFNGFVTAYGNVANPTGTINLLDDDQCGTSRQGSSSSYTYSVYSSAQVASSSNAANIVDDVDNNPDAFESLGIERISAGGDGGGDGDGDDGLGAGAIVGIICGGIFLVVVVCGCIIVVVAIIVILIALAVAALSGGAKVVSGGGGGGKADDGWSSSTGSEMSERGKEDVESSSQSDVGDEDVSSSESVSSSITSTNQSQSGSSSSYTTTSSSQGSESSSSGSRTSSSRTGSSSYTGSSSSYSGSSSSYSGSSSSGYSSSGSD